MMVRRIQAKTIKAVRILIESLLEHGEQNMVDLALALGYSASGARKYVRRMREDGIISCRDVPITGGHTGGMKVMAKLCVTAEVAAEYLVNLESHGAPLRKSQAKSVNFEVGTMVHEIMDDLGVRIRKNTPVKVQRHWMDEALFGPAPESTGGAA